MAKKSILDQEVRGKHDHLPEGAHDEPEIEKMFDAVLSDTRTRGDTMEDIYSWWEEKGFLTAGQFEVLERLYERVTGDHWEPGRKR